MSFLWPIHTAEPLKRSKKKQGTQSRVLHRFYINLASDSSFTRIMFEDMSWKDFQVFFKTKEKAENIVKRVKWADKLEEIRYFIGEKDLNTEYPEIKERQESVDQNIKQNKPNSLNASRKDARTNEQYPTPVPQENKPACSLTKEMVRLALYKNAGSNAKKNWRKLFKLVSSAVLDDRINEIMESEWV